MYTFSIETLTDSPRRGDMDPGPRWQDHWTCAKVHRSAYWGWWAVLFTLNKYMWWRVSFKDILLWPSHADVWEKLWKSYKLLLHWNIANKSLKILYCWLYIILNFVTYELINFRQERFSITRHLKKSYSGVTAIVFQSSTSIQSSGNMTHFHWKVFFPNFFRLLPKRMKRYLFRKE